MVERVTYAVEGWGVGEVWLDAGLLAWHEHPTPAAVHTDIDGGEPRTQLCWSGSARTSPERSTPSRTSSSSSSGARPFSGRSSSDALDPVRRDGHVRRGRCPRRAPERRRARSARSAPRTASRSSCPATEWSPPTGSARTARSGPATSGGFWSSRVSFSEDVRAELAAIAPRARVRPDRRAVRAVPLRGTASPARPRRGLAPPRPGERCRRAAGVLAAALLRRRLRDPHLPAASLRPGDALPAARGGDAAPAARAHRRRRRAGRGPASDPRAASLGRSCCRAAYLRGALLAAGSVSPPPSPHLEVRCETRAGAETVAEAAAAEGGELRVTERGDQSLAYAKGIDAIAGVLAAAARATRRSPSRSGRSCARRAPTPTASRTPTTQTSSGPAARRTSSSRRCAACNARDRLDELSHTLREVAELRLKNPSLSLRDLGRKCDPAVSKATAHRRLRAVLRIAQR